MFLGVPFNIASYSLLTMMLAQVCDYEPGEFVHTFGDLHLYNNHFDQAREYLNKFLEATTNKEYNDKIKSMRENAEQSLRMMMW